MLELQLLLCFLKGTSVDVDIVALKFIQKANIDYY